MQFAIASFVRMVFEILVATVWRLAWYLVAAILIGLVVIGAAITLILRLVN